MPIAVSAGPFRHEQHPDLLYGLPAPIGSWSPSHLPPTGPMRAADCVPNKCHPNGMRNPYAAYTGETYAPSSHTAEQRQMETQRAMQGSVYGGASVHGGAMYGGGMGGSVSLPGGSVIVPSIRSVMPSGSVSGLGGMRVDDGWNGGSGRVHAGHSPDMTSTAGAMPRVGAGSWYQTGSSPLNHARLTPAASFADGTDYLAPPVAFSMPHSVHAHRPRRASVVPAAVDDGCCHKRCSGGVARANSTGRAGVRIREAGSPGGHYRKMSHTMAAGSPLRTVASLVPGERLERKASSHRSRRSTSRCDDCEG